MIKKSTKIRNNLFLALSILIQLSCASSKTDYLYQQETPDTGMGEIIVERESEMNASGMKAYVLDQIPNISPNALFGSINIGSNKILSSNEIGSNKDPGGNLFFYYPPGAQMATIVSEPDRLKDYHVKASGDIFLDVLLRGSDFKAIRHDIVAFTNQIKKTPSIRYQTTVNVARKLGSTRKEDALVSLDSATAIGIAGTDEPLFWKRPTGTAHVYIILNSFAAT